MMGKYYSVSRSSIDENNDNASRSAIVFRNRIVGKLTSAAELTSDDQFKSETIYKVTSLNEL